MNENTEQQKKSTIGEKIIAAAKSGKLKMRPRWHFVLRAVLWLAGAVIAVLAALYFASLFLFINRETGIWLAPVFGWRGVLIFLASAPWLIILSVLVFALALEILVRRYGFTYRLPLLYSALAVLLFVFAGAALLVRTPLHENLSRCPRGDRLLEPAHFVPEGPPCGTGVYRDLGPRRFHDFYYGTVKNIAGADFIIITRQREDFIVRINSQTRLPFGAQFQIGDELAVVGDRKGDQIDAFGIVEINR